MKFLPPVLRWPLSWLFLFTAVCLEGCTSPDDRLPSPVPVTTQRHEWGSGAPKRDRTLLVFLPGKGAMGKDFARQGFLSALDHTDPNDPERSACFYGMPPDAPVDAVTVDLTYPYYEQRTAINRLHDDIIAPARAQGYRQIWLVGCSLGGLGAILCDSEHPGEISGIVALGPYLGDKGVVAEIEAAGGLDHWHPHQPLAPDDFQRRLWQAVQAGHYGQPGHVPLVLGYGEEDRFAYGHKLLAANLPPNRVFAVFGFHNWGTWHQLWREILKSPVSPLAAPALRLSTLPKSHRGSGESGAFIGPTSG